MTRPDWQLRSAVDSDRETIIKMLVDARLPVEGLEEQYGDGYIVAVLDGEIVGAGGLEVYGCYGLLRSVVVTHDEQGRGLGAVIVNNRLLWAARRGLHAVYLLTTTVPDFFGHAGFTELSRAEMPGEIQESREYLEICPGSATAMVLRLDPLC